jgi:hypothetical protein
MSSKNSHAYKSNYRFNDVSISKFQNQYPKQILQSNFNKSEKSLYHEKNSVILQKDAFIIDGKRTILRGTSLQWFKLPKEVWEDRILRLKACGYNTIDMYAAWKNHEPEEGKFDFKKYDLKYFLDLAKKHNMYVVFRPGPYICNEMDSGGLPGWLISKSEKSNYNPNEKGSSINIRTNDKSFMDAVQKYFTKINEEIKPYLHTNGGPIILYSVENEYDWWQVLQNFDKHSTKNGKPERPINQKTDTRAYLEGLSAFARRDGINVPITTCPGAGKIGGLDDARDVVPIPNMYAGLKNIEYNTVNLINDMHSDKYQGLYKNVPAGLTETNREANVLKRFVLSGMNSILQFNNMGYFQDGYQNAIIINGVVFDNIKGALDSIGKMYDPSKPGTGYLRPSLGFFPGKGDYPGAAISPSGQFRDTFFNLRRINMFVESFEELISKGYKAYRTSDIESLKSQDRRIVIHNQGTGIKDPDNKYANNNYWLHLGGNSALVGIYNDGNVDRNLGSNSVTAFGESFPRFSKLTVPVEHGLPLSAELNKLDYEYTMLLPVNFPISDKLKLSYSTSEVLSLNHFNDENLLVVYGKSGTEGELKISGKNMRIPTKTPGIAISERNDDSIVFSYKHGLPQSLSLMDNEGKKNRVIILDTHMAGKTWFVDTKAGKSMISGVDYVNLINNKPVLEFSSNEKNNHIITYGKEPLIIRDTSIVKNHDHASGLSILRINNELPGKLLNVDISRGKVIKDIEETKESYDTSKWKHIGDKPSHLENHGIYNGHSWYRAEFTLSKEDLKTRPSLWIDQAGDFEGIYINGKYVSTVIPIGSEINNKSKDSGYKFEIPKEILKEGKNIITFKNEIWGHGGILLPQGTLNRVNAFGYSFPLPFVRLKIPYISYDSKKGLSGEAKFNEKPITNWTLRPDLGGKINEYHKPGFDDSRWLNSKVPISLEKGDVLWYRTKFNYNDLPKEDKWKLPMVLNLKGKDAKATIYLNGKLIGRWISDNELLKRGNWFVPVKDIWSSSSTDEFPIPREALKKGTNVFSIAFEDASDGGVNAPSGRIDDVSLKIAREGKALVNGKPKDIEVIQRKLYIE